MKWDWLEDYLSFTRSQRKGLTVIAVLMAGSLLFMGYAKYFVKPDLVDQEAIYAKLEQKLAENKAKQDSIRQAQIADGSLFYFDPNTLDQEGWIKLGLSARQAAGLIKYRSTGVIFRKPQDLKKAYTVSDTFFGKIEPFIKIEEANLRASRAARKPSKDKSAAKTATNFQDEGKTNFYPPTNEPKTKAIAPIQLNDCDTTALKALPGIGSFYAKMIVRKREELGGFYHKNQLLEVYKMRPENFEKFASYLQIDTALIAKQNLNTALEEDLKKHPYLSWKQAKAIVKFREQHGPFSAVQDLINSTRFTTEDVTRLAPYFTTK